MDPTVDETTQLMPSPSSPLHHLRHAHTSSPTPSMQEISNYRTYVHYLVIRSIFITGTPYILLPSSMAFAGIFLQHTSIFMLIWLVGQLVIFSAGCVTHKYINDSFHRFPSLGHRVLIILNMIGVTSVMVFGLVGVTLNKIPFSDKNDALSVVSFIIITYLILRIVTMSFIGYSRPLSVVSPVPHPPSAWKYQRIQADASYSELICCICTDKFVVNDMLAVLECGHSYHQTCIKGWLPINATCPVCRLVVGTRDTADANLMDV
jgi:hypothetical protein